MDYPVHIRGIGAHLPEQAVSNDDLTKFLDTSDEWISQRTGIRQRHKAEDGVYTSDLAVAAAREALADAGKAADDIDLIVVATTSSDRSLPSTAGIVQSKLGLGHITAFDVQAACSGFIAGLNVVSSMLRLGHGSCALLIGAETLTRLLDWQDRGTAVLFGDGAGAVVLEAVPDGGETHIIDSYTQSDGNTDILLSDGGISLNGEAGKIRMDGKAVFRHAVNYISDSAKVILARNEVSLEDVDWFVPHQANRRIIDKVAEMVGLEEEKVVISVDRHANTSSASIPLALCEAVRDGRVKSGDLILLGALGAGLVWGSALIRWP